MKGLRTKMDKEVLKLNYIDILTKDDIVKTDKLNFISLEQIKRKFAQLQDEILQNRFFVGKQVDSLERLIELKFAYINILMAIKKLNISEQPTSEGMKKDQIITLAKEYENAAKTNKDTKKEKGNLYNKLDVRSLATIEEIKRKYEMQLRALNEELNEIINNIPKDTNQLKGYQGLFLDLKNVYEEMSNPEYKLAYDEKSFLNFNPDSSKKISSGGVSEIIYIPRKIAKTKKEVKAIILKNYQQDEIIIIKTGNLGAGKYQIHGKSVYQDARALEEYAVIKKYSNPELAAIRKEKAQQEGSISEWSESAGGEIFIIYTNLNHNLLINPNVDPKYVGYHANVLFSNLNMEEAIKHNGGYIGQVVYKQNDEQYPCTEENSHQYGEYIVRHDPDNVFLAVNFQATKNKYKIGNTPVRIQISRKRDEEER